MDLGLDLNSGTSGDGDDSFGTTTVRSQAIKVAIAKLWPNMARLVEETLTPSTTALEYTSLTVVKDVEAVDLIGGAYAAPIDKGNNFRFLFTETTPGTPVRRLRLPGMFGTGEFTSIRVIGYTPYDSVLAESDTLDVPAELEWVVTTGARAEIYRRQLNQRINYERYNVQSRDNDVTVQELVTLYGIAAREFADAIAMNSRSFATGHTFRP